MILKGSQRGGGKQLALHLLNTRDNEHVEVHEIRGFVSNDVVGALKEAYATSRGTKCTQFLFSVSLSPPPQERVAVETFEDAIRRIDERNNLDATLGACDSSNHVKKCRGRRERLHFPSPLGRRWHEVPDEGLATPHSANDFREWSRSRCPKSHALAAMFRFWAATGPWRWRRQHLSFWNVVSQQLAVGAEVGWNHLLLPKRFEPLLARAGMRAAHAIPTRLLESRAMPIASEPADVDAKPLEHLL